MDMSRMIFITGFARGGTSWLRDCVDAHPLVERIPKEMTIFRDHAGDKPAIERFIADRVREVEIATGHTGRLVNKAPANAPHIGDACRMFPEAKFLFIIRDPRDVYISHKRGNKEWMRSGANATVEGCMGKTRNYYEAFEAAKSAPNLMLVRYEDLHQDFDATITRVYEFLGLPAETDIVSEVYKSQNFWAVASRNQEDRDSGRRKGVIGDWVNFLDADERRFFETTPFWREFMDREGYTWKLLNYEGMFRAMREAGCQVVGEEVLLAGEFPSDRVSVLMTHDIDVLSNKVAPSILDCAKLEADNGFKGVYYFLPVDDQRYSRYSPKKIEALIAQIKALGHDVGLHLNCAERFFAADMPDVGNDHPDIEKAVAYLHEQIDAYEQMGLTIRTSSAHGYGRRKKTPNNRDTPRFTQELASRGIRIWDNDLRDIFMGDNAPRVGHLTDVGGALAVKGFTNPARPDDPALYRALPAGSVIHVLVHPGNYEFNRPLTLGLRRNKHEALREKKAGAARRA